MERHTDTRIRSDSATSLNPRVVAQVRFAQPFACGVWTKKTLSSARRSSSPGQRIVARSSVSLAASFQLTNCGCRAIVVFAFLRIAVNPFSRTNITIASFVSPGSSARGQSTGR